MRQFAHRILSMCVCVSMQIVGKYHKEPIQRQKPVALPSEKMVNKYSHKSVEKINEICPTYLRQLKNITC